MFDPIDKSFDKDSLQTPVWLFRWLNTHYDFDVDLCASDDHHFCDHYYTKDNSCLDVPYSYWSAAFCNCPYSDIQPFLDYAITGQSRRNTTVMLIPELNGEKRTKDIMRNATSIIHFDRRISFIRPDTGEPYKGNNRGSIAIEFAPKSIDYKGPQHSLVDLDRVENKYA